MTSMNPEDDRKPGTASTGSWAMPLLAAVLGIVAVFGWIGMNSERQKTAQLASANQTLTASMTEMQSRMQSMSQQISSMQASQQAAKTPPAVEEPVPVPQSEPQVVKQRPQVARKKVAKPPAEFKDPRVDQLQSKLSDQEQALASARAEMASTREDLASTRADMDRAKQDLEGQIGNTRSELNGAIAKTHEEVVALQKRGDRNYYEFDLIKSKEFSQVGPLGLALRKADTKKKSFEVQMMVDDQKLQKKGVNLFEPILISMPDSAQPLQLVVNSISKDRVKGYISEPKYKRSELASGSKGEVKLQELQQR